MRKRVVDKGEYGVIIGSPWRVWWFDLLATRYGVRVQDATNVAFTVVYALIEALDNWKCDIKGTKKYEDFLLVSEDI